MADLIDEDDEDPINFTEKTERSWRVYLRHFEAEVLPVFIERGYTKGEALIIWELNRMKNVMLEVVEGLNDGD